MKKKVSLTFALLLTITLSSCSTVNNINAPLFGKAELLYQTIEDDKCEYVGIVLKGLINRIVYK